MTQRNQPEQLQPRRGRKRRLRPVIVQAATALFAEGGFEQPTMDEVAAAAGVSKKTLYSYFAGKSALINAVIDELLRALPALHPTEGSLPLRQRLVDAGLQLQALAVHPAAVLLASALARQRLSAQQLARWRQRHEEFEAFLAGLLRRHGACGHPGQAARMFLLLVIGDLRPEPPVPHIVDPPRIERAVDLILRACPQG